MKLALAASMFCFLLACGCVQAQQPGTKSPVYNLRFLIVNDTRPVQTLWIVDGGNPNVAYKSLSDPKFLQWVSGLPRGSEVDYRSAWDSLPMLGNLFRPDAGMGEQLKTFEAYCHSKGIIFCDRFPVI